VDRPRCGVKIQGKAKNRGVPDRRQHRSCGLARADGIVVIHTWHSTADDAERPNRIVWDVGPGQQVQVAAAAMVVRDVLTTLGLARAGTRAKDPNRLPTEPPYQHVGIRLLNANATGRHGLDAARLAGTHRWA